MKRINYLLVFACLSVFSCDDNAVVQNVQDTTTIYSELSEEDISVSFDEGIIRIITTMDDGLRRKIKINYTIGEKSSTQIINFNGIAEIDILDQVIDAVYEAIANNYAINTIEVGISINGSPSINKKIIANSLVERNNGATISGKCIPLSNSISDQTLITKIKKWLYRNEKTYSEQMVEGISKSIKSFQTSENIWRPVTNEMIPAVRDLSGLEYNVTTDIKADYYYLFATNNQHDLDGFIEEVATSDYPQASKSTKGLSAFRNKTAGGLLGLFFIGLNSDWTKTIIPVGLLVVDNFPPICKTDNDINDYYHYRSDNSLHNNDIELPKYNIKIVVDKDVVPLYKGYLTLKTNMFHGNAAQFEVSFNGDVESISIKREIHRDYMRYSMTPETKTIKLKDVLSPYHFTYNLDLGLGDNYIPVTVKDFRGNVTSFNYKITMVKNNANDNPQINIDNNINIWQ